MQGGGTTSSPSPVGAAFDRHETETDIASKFWLLTADSHGVAETGILMHAAATIYEQVRRS